MVLNILHQNLRVLRILNWNDPDTIIAMQYILEFITAIRDERDPLIY